VRLQRFAAGSAFTIGDLHIQSFTVPHDSIDPCGFTVASPSHGVKIGLAMDLGYIPENVRYHLNGCELILLESNHDLEMLKVGPYPWALKQRVMGRKGHLSNDAAADFLAGSFDGRARTLVLGHLSEHNNHPEIARMCAAQALARRGCRTSLSVAHPRIQSELFTF
jgi:phosphoribosyl 1,2-cyclic phosphodiesterase